MNLSTSAKVCLLFLAVFGFYSAWKRGRIFSHSAPARTSVYSWTLSAAAPPPGPVEPAAHAPFAPSASRRIPYEITREWPIGVDGVGRTVAFTKTPVGLNDETLRALGDTLRSDTAPLKKVHVMIFSDARAAKLQPAWAAMKTSKAETSLCDAAYVGLYDRDAATGFEKLDCKLGGVDGKQFLVVDYHDLPLPVAVAHSH